MHIYWNMSADIVSLLLMLQVFAVDSLKLKGGVSKVIR